MKVTSCCQAPYGGRKSTETHRRSPRSTITAKFCTFHTKRSRLASHNFTEFVFGLRVSLGRVLHRKANSSAQSRLSFSYKKTLYRKLFQLPIAVNDCLPVFLPFPCGIHRGVPNKGSVVIRDFKWNTSSTICSVTMSSGLPWA